MVDIIRRDNTRIIARDKETPIKMEQQAVADWQKVVGGTTDLIDKSMKQKQSDYMKTVETNLKEGKAQMEREKKAYDASDRLIATDRAGQLKNDLLRWNMEKRQSNPTYIGSREHESDMRAEYSRLAEMYGKGLGEVGTAEFNTKTQGYVNQFAENDIKWAYQQKLKQGEESAKASAQQIEQTAALHGANGDIQGFKDSFAENAVPLQEYMSGVTSPENTAKAISELGRNSMFEFYDNMAKTNPVMAKALLDSPENFKETVPEDLLVSENEALKNTQEKSLKEEIVLLNAGIANEKDKNQKKKLEKLKKEANKKLEKLDEDTTEQTLESLRQDVKKSVDKTIDYQINLIKAEEEKMKNQKRIENSLAFMDNPIVYRAKVGDEQLLNEETYKNFPKLKTLQNEIYDLSDKVGDGKVNPAVMHKIVEQVASITLGDDGNVDVNILKAFDAELALRKAGASPEQLQTFHKLTANALTDSEFKTKVAALAGKSDFDTMFLNKPSRDRSFLNISSWTRTAKEDDIAYVEKMGREAYLGAMEKISDTNNPMALEEALKFYDDKVAETYDFIKRDVIDVDYVKNQLAKMGHAMVELNGNMTKIVGRLPNGEYIVESTGEKVNGGF